MTCANRYLTNPPDQNPTRLELIVNAKAAKAPGARNSQSMLARADEVIE